MKTVLRELIDKWEKEVGSYIPDAPIYIYRSFIEDAKAHLEKEKMMIAQSFENGAFEFQGTNKEVTNGDGIDYFNENFGQD